MARRSRSVAEPDDLEARLALARDHLAQQDLMAVWNDTQFVLEREPGNPRALSYQALVRLAMGQADVAETMLKQAMAAAPDLLDAHLHLAVVYARTGRDAQAEATLRGGDVAVSRAAGGPAGADAGAAADRGHEAVDPGAAGAHAGSRRRTTSSRPRWRPRTGVRARRPRWARSEAGMPARLSGVVELDRSAQGRVAGGGIVFVTVARGRRRRAARRWR